MLVGTFLDITWIFVDFLQSDVHLRVARIGRNYPLCCHQMSWFPQNVFKPTYLRACTLTVILRHHLLWSLQHHHCLGVIKETVFGAVNLSYQTLCLQCQPIGPNYVSKCSSHCKDACRNFSWHHMNICGFSAIRCAAGHAIFYLIFAFFGHRTSKFSSRLLKSLTNQFGFLAVILRYHSLKSDHNYLRLVWRKISTSPSHKEPRQGRGLRVS